MNEFFEELKRRRVVRAVVTYGAVVFVALQVADLTFEALGLPSWSYTFLVILSIVGLPVAAVMAWLFDLRRGHLQSEAARAQGAPPKRVSPLVAVAALASTLGVAGAVTMLLLDPPPAAEGLDRTVIAVAPFRVAASDPQLAYLREGALDLLAAKLTASPRAVDPRTLLAAWRGVAGDVERDLPRDRAVRLAESLGAGRILLGSIVGRPDGLTLSASLLDVPSGEVVAETTLNGAADSIQTLVDALAVQLVGAQVGAPLENLTSRSMSAVRHYLEGRSLYRRGDYPGARTAYERAVADDSTFAAAALGLYQALAMGVLQLPLGEAQALAWEHRDRLGSEDRAFLGAVFGVDYPRPSFVRDQIAHQEEVVRRLPDRPEAWYELGDHLLHEGHVIGIDDALDRALAAFERAVELDPTYYTAALHAYWTMRLMGMSGEEWVERLAGKDAGIPHLIDANLVNALDSAAIAALDTLALDAIEVADLLFVPIAPMLEGNLESARMLGGVAEPTLRKALALAATDEERDGVYDALFSILLDQGRTADAVQVSREWADRIGSPVDHDRRMLHLGVIWRQEAPETGSASGRVRAAVESIPDLASAAPAEVVDACLVAVHAASTGAPAEARAIAERLARAFPPPSDATAAAVVARTCVLLLEAIAAFPRGAGGIEALEELARWLDRGPGGQTIRALGNLTAAELFLAAGDPERARSHAARRVLNPSAPRYYRRFKELESRALEALGRTEEAAEAAAFRDLYIVR